MTKTKPFVWGDFGDAMQNADWRPQDTRAFFVSVEQLTLSCDAMREGNPREIQVDGYHIPVVPLFDAGNDEIVVVGKDGSTYPWVKPVEEEEPETEAPGAQKSYVIIDSVTGELQNAFKGSSAVTQDPDDVQKRISFVGSRMRVIELKDVTELVKANKGLLK